MIRQFARSTAAIAALAFVSSAFAGHASSMADVDESPEPTPSVSAATLTHFANHDIAIAAPVIARDAVLASTSAFDNNDASGTESAGSGAASFALPLGPFTPTRAPDALLPWYNGSLINIGSNVACLSNPPIQQIRTQSYTGFTLRPGNRTPAVGEVFYTHLIVSHPGNPCSGSAVALEMILPAGVQPAPSVGNPAFCFAVIPPSQGYPNGHLADLSADPGYGCPQTFAQGLEGLRVSPPRGGYNGSGTWYMRQGVFLELLIPLIATQPYVGNASIRFRVNPDIAVVGHPSVPLHVNNDVIFRFNMEDDLLPLEVCGLSGPPAGCA